MEGHCIPCTPPLLGKDSRVEDSPAGPLGLGGVQGLLPLRIPLGLGWLLVGCWEVELVGLEDS